MFFTQGKGQTVELSDTSMNPSSDPTNSSNVCNKKTASSLSHSNQGQKSSDCFSNEGTTQFTPQNEAETFREFNTWSQITGAIIKISFETYNLQSSIGHKRTKTEVCTLAVSLPSQGVLNLAVQAFGQNRKQAKKTAYRMIIAELTKNGILKSTKDRGISLNQSVSFSNQSKSDKYSENDSNSNSKTKFKKMNKKIGKLVSKMQASLRMHDFKTACMCLCDLCEANSFRWNNICYLWNYALTQRKLEYIASILDLINYKEIPSKKSEHLPKNDKKFETINQILFNKYKFLRIPNSNPFEVYDEHNLIMSDPELPKNVPSHTKTDGSFQSQNDSCNEFVFQDITEHFEEPALINENNKKTQFSQNTQASIIINNTTNSVVNNTYYCSGNNNSNNPDFKSTYDKFQNMQNRKKKPSTENSSDFSNNPDFKSTYDKFQNMQNRKKKPSTENSSDFSKQTMDDAQINYIQNSIAIENSKDPTRNYHSYKLLESLYDSLLLVGDFHLALQVSELIYSSFLLNERDFISKNASLYYAYLRNLQFIKDLENIYYLNSDCNVIPLTNCRLEEGKFSTQFMNFRPVVNIGSLSDYFQQKVRSLEETTIRQKFCEGDFVMVFIHTFPNQTIEFSFLAKLVEIGNDFQIKLEALLTGELLNALNDQNKVWAMRKLNNAMISENLSKNLIKFCCSNGASLNLSEIIFNPSNSNSAFELNNNKEELTLKNGLNEFQNQALKYAIFNPLTVIDGPKNSGKTVTTIELMLEWSKQSPDQILVCTNDKISLNNLYKELMKIGLRVIRLDHLKENMQSQNFSNFMNNNNSSCVKNKYTVMKKILKEAQIVCCTSLDLFTESIKGFKFTRVIVDDAHKIPEILTLVPISKKCQQLVLCGDSRELVIFSDKIVGNSKGCNISLFNRLINQGIHKFDFKLQYCVESSIVKLSSELFQTNNVVFQEENQIDLWLYGLKWPNLSTRILFINVHGDEKINNGSLENSAELKVLIGLLSVCLKCNYINHQNLGIITMYEEQKNKIINQINSLSQKCSFFTGLAQDLITRKQQNQPHLSEIDTIDNFQSKEKDLILFSAVRSNDQRKLGYLKDEKRIYKLLSKAKKGLIILGDLETLITNKMWSNLIGFCSGNRSLIVFRG